MKIIITALLKKTGEKCRILSLHCDWAHHSEWTRSVLFPMNTHYFRGDTGHTLTFGQERSLSLFISGNPQLCPITQKIKRKSKFFFLYIDIPSPSFPSHWLFLIPSLGSCELADVDYSINSLFIYLSVHPSIDSSFPFQCCCVWINSPYEGAREGTAERFKPKINGKFQNQCTNNQKINEI